MTEVKERHRKVAAAYLLRSDLRSDDHAAQAIADTEARIVERLRRKARMLNTTRDMTLNRAADVLNDEADAIERGYHYDG